MTSPTHAALPDESVEYRAVPGWPGYFVGSDGSVWSARHLKRAGASSSPFAVWKLLRPENK